jgi:hypothetical protein
MSDPIGSIQGTIITEGVVVVAAEYPKTYYFRRRYKCPMFDSHWMLLHLQFDQTGHPPQALPLLLLLHL